MSDLASAQFMSAFLVPDGMPAALSALAGQGGADGAVLVFSHENITVRAIGSPELDGHLAEYVSGDRPPDPRGARVNPTITEGFRLDQDDFSQRQISRDPFYQDFLKPRGLGWHACALLGETELGGAVHLSLKRVLDRGPFTPPDLALLSTCLPAIRSAVGFTQAGAALRDAFTSALQFAGRPAMVGFDSLGEAFALGGSLLNGTAVSLREGALRCAEPNDQGRLNAAVDRMRAGARQAALIISAQDGARWCVSLKRWPSSPHINVAFIALISPLDFVEEPSSDWMTMARDLFDLSQAEARIAGLVGQGLSVPAISDRLAIRPGTVRNQLKAVFAKTNVTRQAELTVLLSRLQSR